MPGEEAETSRTFTLADYANAKRLDATALWEEFQLATVGVPGTRGKGFRLAIPYFDRAGTATAIRFRKALDGPGRFSWEKGATVSLYGLHRLPPLNQPPSGLFLVEGESDVHTAAHHDVLALGVPGADMWSEARDAKELDGVERICAVHEPDGGGERLLDKLAQSAIAPRVLVVSLAPHKDLSALHLVTDAEGFKNALASATAAARPLSEIIAERREKARDEAFRDCLELVRQPDVLLALDDALDQLNLVGEREAARLLFLSLITCLFPKPASAVVKGSSSGGKSFLIEAVLKLMPPDTVVTLTSMSPKAMIYDERPLSHRFLFVREAPALDDDDANHLIRTLLSESPSGKFGFLIRGLWRGVAA